MFRDSKYYYVWKVYLYAWKMIAPRILFLFSEVNIIAIAVLSHVSPDVALLGTQGNNKLILNALKYIFARMRK